MRSVTKKRGNHGQILLKEKLALNYRVKAYTSLSSITSLSSSLIPEWQVRLASKRVATIIGGHPLNLGVVGRLDLPTSGLLCKITLMSELARKSLVLGCCRRASTPSVGRVPPINPLFGFRCELFHALLNSLLHFFSRKFRRLVAGLPLSLFWLPIFYV